MFQQLFGFTARQVERLLRMLQWYESRLAGGVPDELLPNWQHVRITGPAVPKRGSGSSSGSGPSFDYYPGVVVIWDAMAEEEREYGEVWVRDINSEPREVGFACDMKQSGNIKIADETRPLFVTASANNAATGAYIAIDVVVCAGQTTP
jgi:hypothetical protein